MKAWHAAAVLGLAIVAITAARVDRGARRPQAAVAPSALGVQAMDVSAVATPAAAAPAQARLEREPRLAVAFLLDPALTRSLYMGERWVSPPVFDFAQPGREFSVRAKVQWIGRDGEATDVGGRWSTPDPGMLEVDDRGGEVTLRVREPGEGALTVATSAGTRTLRVRATRTADAMQVAIAQ